MNRIPQQAIYSLLGQLRGTVGLYVHYLESDEVLEINPERLFPSASVIKIPVLALLLKDVAEGRIDWHGRREVAPENRVGGTGILLDLDRDYVPTVATLARLMIVLSDNAATNEILDMVTIDRVNQFCQSLGMVHTKLMRKMMDFASLQAGKNNFMCARETGQLLVKLARGDFLSPEISQKIVEIMEHQLCRNMLPALIPAVPYDASEEEKQHLDSDMVLVANKTGDLEGLQHDVGIFTLPDGRRYVIAMFTGDLVSNGEGVQAIAQVSKVVYEALR